MLKIPTMLETHAYEKFIYQHYREIKMSHNIVIWSNREIKMLRNIVFGLNCEIKMPRNPKIAQKTREIKMPRIFFLPQNKVPCYEMAL